MVLQWRIFDDKDIGKNLKVMISDESDDIDR